jgi:ATP-dependent helicase/nuclease subunit B
MVATVIKINEGMDVLAEFAKNLLQIQVHPSDIVLLPHRRAVRTLREKMLLLSQKKAVVLPNILTYADIDANKHIFLPLCPDINISKRSILSPVELKVLVVATMLRLGISLAHLDTYIAFLVKFYTYSGEKKKLERYPQALEFIEAIEKELLSIDKKLPQQLRNETINEIIEKWNEQREIRIFSVAVANIPPYVQKFLNFIRERAGHYLFYTQESALLSKPTLIECANEIEESNVVGLIIRESLQHAVKPIAVVTSDRQMVRRVKQSLKRWDIAVDDTTDDFLLDAPATKLFLLLYQLLASKECNLVQMLAVLKHPMCIYNSHPELDHINCSKLRKPVPYKSFAEFFASFTEKSDLIEELKKLFLPWHGNSLEEIARQHWELFNKIYLGTKQEQEYLILEQYNNDFEAVVQGRDIKVEHYYPLMQHLLATYNYRKEGEFIGDVVIITAQEARLHKFAKVILMGANEGQFPYIKQEGTLIGFSGERELGFESIDDKINEARKDFNEILANPDLVITRSLFKSNKERLPCRFLEFIEIKHENKYLLWLNKLKEMELVLSPRPSPKVPLKLRPAKISVSAIEKLMRDPYAYYAEYILKLKPFDEVAVEVSHREFGIWVHEFLKENEAHVFSREKYVQACSNFFASKLKQKPRQTEFWLHHVAKIASWVWELDHARTSNVQCNHEIYGELFLAGIKVSAIADRIDIDENDAVVIDFKTGAIPAESKIKEGLFPQLPIEALILAEGGFKFAQLEGKNIILKYLQLTGKGEEIGKISQVKYNLSEVKNNLQSLLHRYFREAQPFFASAEQDDSGKTRKFKQLSRLDEWFDTA